MINVGIDIHKIKCIVTIKDGKSRKELEQTEYDNTVAGVNKFIKYIKTKYKNQTIRAVCESTANYWYRTHDMLEDNGIDTILAHPAKTKIIAQAKLKDDKVDSGILADLLRSDMVYESYVPNKHYRGMRSLARMRLGLVQSITRHKNKIHSIIAKYDHVKVTEGLFTKKSVKQLLRKIELSPIDRLDMDMHLDSIEFIQKQKERVEIEIAKMAQADERTKLLMSIPGIGYITALTILSEIVDVNRFATAEKLVSYAGIAPSHRDSADTHKGGSMTKQGSVWLRHAMVDSATSASRYDDRMHEIHTRIAKRRGRAKAKVAVARHMLEIIWHMLKKNESYRTQNEKLTERKYKIMEKKASMS